ncbi:hypothetical protein [Yinghuangia sp. YIM S09857]|uniref:pPIWI_RE_Y domain-containing protein n=1 Tax=Yinghuangia sp. YIM S09857 TaxID=3436929 RepID=UPI003F536D4E
MMSGLDPLLPTPAAEWAAHDGLPLLRTLANAVVRLDAEDGLDAFTLPYPPEVQRALDRTVLSSLLKGALPPASLPELLEWCRVRPIMHWPLDLPPDVVGPADRLLDEYSGRPTEICHELADRARDSATEYRDRIVIAAAFRLCREFGEEASYAAFRRLLVTRPVLTEAEEFQVLTDAELEPVHELVRIIYLPVPHSYQRDGAYAACRRCLTLLVPVRDGNWWCERDRCRRQGPPPTRRLDPREVGALVQLERPLRQFVTGPGRAEIDVEHALARLGLDVRMWPGFDAYDLLVTFPDGHRWALDVKDWANPVLLGRNARPVPQRPPYDEAFWVVPRHRVDDRPGYVQAYLRHRPEVARAVPLRTDAEIIAAARARMRRDPRPAGGRRRRKDA